MGKYSETLTDHVMSPRNCGVMESPDLTGHAGAPGRGAFMILFLRVDDDRVAAAKYHTAGCGLTIASGSMLTELIVGRTLAECAELTAEKLIEALDGVPPDKLHCPALAIAALRDALSHSSADVTQPSSRPSGGAQTVVNSPVSGTHQKLAED
jgi:nitrogen fixation NifU-like protein